MKYSFYLVILLFISCSKVTCVEFAHMKWCLENAAYSEIKDSELFFSNNRDGLTFEARILSDCDLTKNDTSEYPHSFVTSKNRTPFYVYYKELHPELKLASVKFVQGIAIGDSHGVPICIEWTGVNEKKALRLIKQLVQD